MEFQKRKISELKHADYNPRKSLKAGDAEFEKIKRSIQEFGYVDPIIVNADNTIIGGHQRATVLNDLGYVEVDVVVLDIPKEREKALNVALNKISGEWDEIKLTEVLKDIMESGLDADITGFDIDEIQNLMLKFSDEPEAEQDVDIDDLVEETPKTQAGDIWFLGKHRLMCGDSTNADDVAKLMAGEQAKLVVTDPPYNVDYEGTAGKIMNDKMTNNAFIDFLTAAFQNMADHSEAGAAIYVFHADSEGLNFRNAFINAGYTLRQTLIWVKNSLVMGRQDYQWKHEPILYGWKDGAAHYFIDDRTQTTVINCDKPTKSTEHPTMKPTALICELINNSSKAGWLVLDLFGGSGSTLIACEQLQRRCCTMELDTKYADVIVKRYAIYTDDTSDIYRIDADGQKQTYDEVFG